MGCHPSIRIEFNSMNQRRWKWQLERLSICTSKEKGRPASESHGRVRSRITRIRERKGLDRPPFGETHSSKDKESQKTSWCPSEVRKEEGIRSNAGDVEEITSKGFSLSKE